MTVFLRDLWGALRQLYLDASCDDTARVVVVGGVDRQLSLSPGIKALFPSTVSIPPNRGLEGFLKEAAIVGLGNVPAGDDALAHILAASREKSVQGGGSVALTKAISRECALRWLQHQHGDGWMRGAGLDPLYTSTHREPKAMVDAPVVATTLASLSEECKLADALKSVSAPVSAVRWDDIGGLHRQRQEILDVLLLPREHPDLFALGGGGRKGVLLFGPPGQ